MRNVLIAVLAAGTVITWSADPAAQAGGPSSAADTTREITTQELESILAARSATVLDVRPHREYAISHIPGAANVAPKPGVTLSMYLSDVAEIDRLVRGNKSTPLILYCNGVHCGKSKRLAAELFDAGFTAVRRYQSGIPMWRAVGNVCEIELEGIRYIQLNDRTAVVIDVRERADFQRGTLPDARNIPRSLVLAEKDAGEVRRAKDDGRLPMEDHNTRIVVVGKDAADARYVAEALAREAFHNVSYFAGALEAVKQSLQQEESR